MKKLLLLVMMMVTIAFAQPWTYNLGTEAAGIHSTNTASTIFLPTPSTNGGTARVRVGSGAGSIAKRIQTDYAFGSDTYLRITAPSSASLNKFSVYDYTPAKVATFKATLRFGDANGTAAVSSGSFVLGIGDGTNFSDNNSFSGSQYFTALQFIFAASSGITTNYRNTAAWTEITTDGIVQLSDVVIEIIMNNSTSTVNYDYGVTPSTVAANKFDLYVNGTLVGDDLTKAQLGNDSNIDSFIFYGESSTGNVANLFIDNIMYSNTATDPAFPVELTSFTSTTTTNTITLNWATATEVDNYGFEVERSADNTTFTKVGFVAGAGNSNVQKQYSFVDGNLTAGTYYYRLRQVDTDGSFEYSQVISSSVSETPATFSLNQNYPNPFNPSTKISFALAKDSDVKLTVFNTLGEEVAVLVNSTLTAGTHSVDFNASNLTSGMYLYKIAAGEFSATKKMVLTK